MQVFGLPGLLCTLSASLSEDSPPVEVYGPVGLRQFVRVALNIARSQICYEYSVHELCHDINPADYDGLVSSPHLSFSFPLSWMAGVYINLFLLSL